jgi:hypothetical protein
MSAGFDVVGAFLRVEECDDLATVFHEPPTVRSALARKTALSFAKAFSM